MRSAKMIRWVRIDGDRRRITLLDIDQLGRALSGISHAAYYLPALLERTFVREIDATCRLSCSSCARLSFLTVDSSRRKCLIGGRSAGKVTRVVPRGWLAAVSNSGVESAKIELSNE